MSRRHEIKTYVVLDKVIIQDEETLVTNVKNVDKVAYQIDWSIAHNVVCDVEVYASNNYDEKDPSLSTWTLVNPNTGIRIDQLDPLGCHILNIQSFAFDFLKVKINFVSGIGNVKVSVSGHSIGA